MPKVGSIPQLFLTQPFLVAPLSTCIFAICHGPPPPKKNAPINKEGEKSAQTDEEEDDDADDIPQHLRVCAHSSEEEEEDEELRVLLQGEIPGRGGGEGGLFGGWPGTLGGGRRRGNIWQMCMHEGNKKTVFPFLDE